MTSGEGRAPFPGSPHDPCAVPFGVWMTPVTEQSSGETTSRPRPARRPRRGGGTDVVARVVLVLVLLGVAAQGLSGRRHLDWTAISDDPGPTWIDLVLIAGAAFLAVGALRALRRMLQMMRDDADDDAPNLLGTRAPWYAYLASGTLIAIVILLIYLLLKSAVDQPLQFRNQGRVNTTPLRAHTSGDKSAIDPWLVLIAVLAGVGLAFAGFRRRVGLAEEMFDVDEEPSGEEALADAVAAAEVELDAHGDDTRAAIIAAYTAMERQLVASGTARNPSDTPTDFLLRAMAASRVSPGSATRLTELFREARFSTHPMPETARADAARALARVADDLAGRRA
jgi:hypothetical protein